MQSAEHWRQQLVRNYRSIYTFCFSGPLHLPALAQYLGASIVCPGLLQWHTPTGVVDIYDNGAVQVEAFHADSEAITLAYRVNDLVLPDDQARVKLRLQLANRSSQGRLHPGCWFDVDAVMMLALQVPGWTIPLYCQPTQNILTDGRYTFTLLPDNNILVDYLRARDDTAEVVARLRLLEFFNHAPLWYRLAKHTTPMDVMVAHCWCFTLQHDIDWSSNIQRDS